MKFLKEYAVEVFLISATIGSCVWLGWTMHKLSQFLTTYGCS